MIGVLPESLNVNGTEYEINTDFRIALLILQAANDNSLNDREKAAVILYNLFCDEVKEEDIEEALKEAAWFLDGGDNYDDTPASPTPIISWEQDQRYYFSAVNKVAGHDIRKDEHLHWWSFLSLMAEIGEGMFAQMLNVRRKRSEGKKLTKDENEFFKKYKSIVIIKPNASKEYLEEMKEEKERVKKLLGFT